MSDDIGQFARERLMATAAVTNLCKRDDIFADVRGANCGYPSIVVSVPQTIAHEDLNTDNRMLQATVDVLVFDNERKPANALAKVIRDSALAANLSGQLHGMDIKEVSLVAGPNEGVIEPFPGAGSWLRVTQQTFSIWASPL